MRRDSFLALLLIASIYLLVGTIGHDPWRGDDASNFGPVFEQILSGPALIPDNAGTPALEFGPLFYWLAALVSMSLQWLLPLHDGARLTTALLMASALFALWHAARQMHGEGSTHSAVLLTLGSLGLVVHVHEMQPAIGLLAAQAWVLWFIASASSLAWLGAGMAAAAAFLFAGLQGALTTWPILLIALTINRGAALAALAAAILFSLAWALPASQTPQWPLWLDAQLRSLTPEPFSIEAVTDWLKLFAWFLWPLWPLAMLALWRKFQGASIQHVPLLLWALFLALLGVVLGGGLRPMRMLPLIVPLVLLATPAMERLRRGAAAAFDWFAVAIFSTFGLLLWLAWSALVLQWPPGLARHFKKLAPAFELAPGALALSIGAALALAWVAYLLWRRSGGRDAALTWATGMTMLWCTAAAMLHPWFDHNRSYREAAMELKTVLEDQRDVSCIAGLGLGAAQRSALNYFAGVRIEHEADRSSCTLVLVYTDTRMPPRDLTRYGSRELWRYQRGGGRQLESFALLRRD